jgi:hypothetical protein
MLVWWAAFPFLVLGFWFTFRYRLRQAFVIFIFTTMLTLAYSIFQGNVGTAYRQRAQILVFYFIFVAVGIVLLREKWEERRLQALAARSKLTPHMATSLVASQPNDQIELTPHHRPPAARQVVPTP